MPANAAKHLCTDGPPNYLLKAPEPSGRGPAHCCRCGRLGPRAANREPSGPQPPSVLDMSAEMRACSNGSLAGHQPALSVLYMTTDHLTLQAPLAAAPHVHCVCCSFALQTLCNSVVAVWCCRHTNSAAHAPRSSHSTAAFQSLKIILSRWFAAGGSQQVVPCRWRLCWMQQGQIASSLLSHQRLCGTQQLAFQRRVCSGNPLLDLCLQAGACAGHSTRHFTPGVAPNTVLAEGHPAPHTEWRPAPLVPTAC